MNGMSSGKWYKVLKKLNPRLNVWCKDDNKKHAGIWLLTEDGEYQHLFATERNWVPEASHYDAGGHLLEAGSHRVVKNLLAMKLTTPDKVKRYYKRGFFQMRGNPIIRDPKPFDLKGAIVAMNQRSEETGNVDKEVVAELHHELETNHTTDWQKESRERRLYETERALGTRPERIQI